MSGGTAPRPASMPGQSWASGAKDLVMTALGASRVWATTAHGILNEIYWPAVDQPQVKDFGFLVADNGWWRELKRVNTYTLSTPDPILALPTITHTGPNYQVTLRLVVDPNRDALLIDYNVTGAGVKLYPLLAPHLGVYQQQSPSDGADNTAWVDPADNALFASAPGNRVVCLMAQNGFARGGAGYVGDTDGWTDFSRHQQMTLTFSLAGPGVVALMGELTQQAGVLALAFAETPEQARVVAQQSLAAGIGSAQADFTNGWQAWAAGLKLPGAAQGLSQPVADAIRHSAAVLKTHEDHTLAGAFVAGLATPWGEDTNDPGGYHMVWCRDATESGLALAAAGHTDDAAALLQYLSNNQQPDGHWPRCFFVKGSFDPFAAVQLDEVAFPVVLAAKLEEAGVALPAGTDSMIQSAARYLAQNGPISGVERWEENFGGSPFTIAMEVAALVVAASRLSGQDQQLALALADNWNERLEAFCFVAGGEVDQFFGTGGHYVRIGPTVEQIKLGNQPGPTAPIDAEALVGMEFLYLARIGLRDPRDAKITDTLKVVESMLAADTPSGRSYHRYNIDGYGDWLDGSGWPVRHFGIGRPWPLLTGERGHYEVLIGNSPATQLDAMLGMVGRGGLLPEQIWDADPLPWRFLKPGKPAGSAMPLAWAHSELLKLAIAATTGRPVEMLSVVTNRYHAQVPTSDPWFWRDAAPVTDLPASRSLVVADTQSFTLHFGFDEWQNVAELPSQPLGLGLFGVTLPSGMLTPHASLQFVRRYADGHWETSTRNNVSLNVARAPALKLSVAARARVAAGAKTQGGGTHSRPEFFGTEHSSTFQQAGVASAYAFRPPYPDAVFELLGSLMVDEPRSVLDLGCGTGAIARRLVEVAERVDGVDASAAMIDAGRQLPNGDSPRLRWTIGRAEEAPLDPPYALITAGSSMQWMDWDVVLPRLSDQLTTNGVLALVDNRIEPTPWHAALLAVMQRYSTNPTRDHEYEWIAELERRDLFRRVGRMQTASVRFIQSLDEYVESFHSRSSFARERLGAERSQAFDDAIRGALNSYTTGEVELNVYAMISWGRPLKSARVETGERLVK